MLSTADRYSSSLSNPLFHSSVHWSHHALCSRLSHLSPLRFHPIPSHCLSNCHHRPRGIHCFNSCVGEAGPDLIIFSLLRSKSCGADLVGSNFASTFSLPRNDRVTDLSSRVSFSSRLGSSAAGDLLIALGLTHAFRKCRTGFSEDEKLLKIIIHRSLTTGALTAVSSIAAFCRESTDSSESLTTLRFIRF